MKQLHSCGTATPPMMLVNQDDRHFTGAPTPSDRPLTKPRSPTGVSSFQRRSPVTGISLSWLPHWEQTNRFCQSARGVSGRIVAPFARIGLDFMAAFAAPGKPVTPRRGGTTR